MPYGTASLQLPMRTGRKRPSTNISQMAAAKAQAMCVPMPSSRARVYMRAHQSITEASRKKPAMMNQPPSLIGGMDRPYTGLGGSNESQKSCLTSWIGLQFTEASMFMPMIVNQIKPQNREARPRRPR